MNTYLFNPDRFNQLYRCDYMSTAEWSKFAVSHPIIGVVFLILGSIYMATYIPCLFVMSRRSFYKHSCFKIMLFMGVLDIFCILINCFETGIFMVLGSVFCQAPNFQYITGSLAVGGWSGQCMFCVLLAFNRCVDFWSRKWSIILFDGKRTYVWIALPFLYMLFYVFFTPAATYTSSAIMWFFDPYVFIPAGLVPVDHSIYISWAHSINDYVVISCLVVLYSALVISVRIMAGSGAHRSMQIKVIVQAGVICLLNFVPALIFTVAQFFQPPQVFVIICVLFYQCGNGGAGLVLLALNKTIRQSVHRMVRRRRSVSVSAQLNTLPRQVNNTNNS